MAANKPTIMTMDRPHYPEHDLLPPPPYPGSVINGGGPYPGSVINGGGPYPGSVINGGGPYPGSVINGGGPYPGSVINGGGPYAQYARPPPPPTNGGVLYPSSYQVGPSAFMNTTLPTANGPRYACPHCQFQFSYRLYRGLAKCPYCYQISAIGSYSSCCGSSYLAMGVLLLFLSITATVGTYMAHTGYYFVWIGGIVIGIANIVRGARVLSVKSAQPVLEQSAMVAAPTA